MSFTQPKRAKRGTSGTIPAFDLEGSPSGEGSKLRRTGSDPTLLSGHDTQLVTDVESKGGSNKEPSASRGRICGLPMQVVALLAYCGASTSMVLLNKLVLSTFGWRAPTCLLIFQCLFCVIAVQVCSALGLVVLEGWSWRIARKWAPVNLIFVGMIWTSFFALKALNVPMITVLKNLSNLFTIVGDIYIYNKRYGAGVWMTLLLMAVSAICGAMTDMSFNLGGYAWQIINCGLTAAYSLTLRGVMDKVAPLTRNKTKLDEFSMVFYNNLLSVPLLLLLAGLNGELSIVLQQPALYNKAFVVAAFLTAICGFSISFTSLWFLQTTTATTYSLVGSLNKIPIALFGLVLFESKASWSVENLLSVTVGLLAGVVFVRAKALG